MTFATQMSTLASAIEMANRLEVDTAEASTGILDALTALQALIAGERATDAHPEIKFWRGLLAQALSSGSILNVLRPIIRQVLVDTTTTPEPQGAITQVFDDLFDYMHDNNESVKAAFDETGASFGTPAAGGSNVGDGEILLLQIDEHGYTRDGVFADDYTLEAILDARQLGIEGQEVFSLKGEARAEDGLRVTGTGLDVEVGSLDARSSAGLVSNASFDDVTPATDAVAPTALPGWTDATNGDFSSLEVELGTIYKSTPTSAQDVALRFTANMTLEQDLVAVNGATFDVDSPYVFGFALYRDAAATGTMTFSVGGVSRVITIGSQTDATWEFYWLVATPGSANWFRSFNQNTVKMSYALTSLAVGTCLIDHVVAAPMTRFGAFGDTRRGRGSMGHYIAIRSGPTPWVEQDVFTFSYAGPTVRSKNGYWLARLGLGYLPNRADATEITASGGRTFTFATSTTCTLSSGDLASDGYYAGMLVTFAGTSSNNVTLQVVTVTATVLTFASGITTEGPLSATATINATSSVADGS